MSGGHATRGDQTTTTTRKGGVGFLRASKSSTAASSKQASSLSLSENTADTGGQSTTIPPQAKTKSSLPRLIHRQADIMAKQASRSHNNSAKRKASKPSISVDTKHVVVKKDAVQSPTGSTVIGIAAAESTDSLRASSSSPSSPFSASVAKYAKKMTSNNSISRAAAPVNKTGPKRGAVATTESSPDLVPEPDPSNHSNSDRRRSSLTHIYQSVIAIGSKLTAYFNGSTSALRKKSPSSLQTTSTSDLSLSDHTTEAEISLEAVAVSSPTTPPLITSKKSKSESGRSVATIDPIVPLPSDESEIITTVREDKKSTPDRPSPDQYFFIRNMLPPRSALPSSAINLDRAMLPPKTRSSPPITLVLDLDETLVHCSTSYLQNHDIAFCVDFEGLQYNVQGRLRPFYEEFLKRVSTQFEVVLFTASQKRYAEQCLKYLDPNRQYIKHRLYRDSCLFVTGGYVKDLSALGRDLSKVIIVDNSPQAFAYHLSNGIPIKSWYEDPSDAELMAVLEFLENLVDLDDVRTAIREKYKLEQTIFPENFT